MQQVCDFSLILKCLAGFTWAPFPELSGESVLFQVEPWQFIRIRLYSLQKGILWEGRVQLHFLGTGAAQPPERFFPDLADLGTTEYVLSLEGGKHEGDMDRHRHRGDGDGHVCECVS